jgi:hypothetical protein
VMMEISIWNWQLLSAQSEKSQTYL